MCSISRSLSQGGFLLRMKQKNYLQLLKEAHARHPGDFSLSEAKKKYNSRLNTYVSIKNAIIIDEDNPQFYEEKNKINSKRSS